MEVKGKFKENKVESGYKDELDCSSQFKQRNKDRNDIIVLCVTNLDIFFHFQRKRRKQN